MSYPSNPHILAGFLGNIKGIDGVRSEPTRVTIAVAPGERHVDELPDKLFDIIEKVIDDSVWESEYQDYDAGTVEQHMWTGGRGHQPIIPPNRQPEGYELQFTLVK